jgi:uncharacterized protein (DUF2235 family)
MPRNIVLLSDGTGNGAAKFFRTNVWRVYEALDLTEPQAQVACYDDGVGTSGLKPLRILGGVCGVGLKRNVLRLYRFLCEHYEPGDRIYVFGFSRGAFTIRVLLGLIHSQGVILAARGAGGTDGLHGPRLDALVRQAYRNFRYQFNQTGLLVTAARRVRDAVLLVRDRLLGRTRLEDVRRMTVPAIEFVGLWDTVDAYGLPVDELTDGIDRWVWPLSMPDLHPLPFIRKACHALALDDERNAFHPVLWDESGEEALALDEDRPWPPTHVDDERISQVWFAGMHANVGGGYPQDGLAYESLRWVANAAETRGLRFVPARLALTLSARDPLGEMADSRRGLQGYYRYNPRRIEWLTNGQVHEQGFRLPRRVNGAWTWAPWPVVRTPVRIARPKIHFSAIERIVAAPDGYAPLVLPPEYDVVTEDGRILTSETQIWQTPEANARRAAAQERVWNLVWLRRLLYFAAVLLTLWLLARPWLAGGAGAVLPVERGALSRVIAGLGGWLPGVLSPWVGYFTARPYELLFGGVAVLGLAAAGRWVKGRIGLAMHEVWTEALDPAVPAAARADARPGLLQRVRLHRWYQGAFAVLRRKLLPTLMGVATLVWLAGAFNRVLFETVNGLGMVCTASGTLDRLAIGGTTDRTLDARAFCGPTGLELQAGAAYTIAFVERPGPWLDAAIVPPFPGGFTSVAPLLSVRQRAVFLSGMPFRRAWTRPWFAPLARIGADGFDQYPLEQWSQRITARTSGELFLFVNDTLLPLLPDPKAGRVRVGWQGSYRNNEGLARVRITRVQ